MTVESGEAMFDRLTAALGMVAERVAEAGSIGEPRPDFTVLGTDGSRFHAEVKVVSPSTVEAKEIRQFRNGGLASFGGTPGERLRGLIAKANRQLRVFATDGLPGVLVVFNPELLMRWHTEPYAVLTAMRGLDVVDVSVPMDPRESPVFGHLHSGPKKRMTANDNTSTAAILCPEQIKGGEWSVNVYHNRFAARPLPVRALAHPSVRQWRISQDERDWAPISMAST